MRRRKKKCPWCQDSFIPHPRLGHRQVSCGKTVCCSQQANQAKQRWRWRNREIQRQMVKDWFATHPHYLQEYRRRKTKNPKKL